MTCNESLDRLAKLEVDPMRLIWGALRNIPTGTIYPRRPRWSVVRDTFAVGSTTAWDLCAAVGLDPDEEIGSTDWEAAEAIHGVETFSDEIFEAFFGIEEPPESERH